MQPISVPGLGDVSGARCCAGLALAMLSALAPSIGAGATLTVTSQLTQLEGTHPNPLAAAASPPFHDGDSARFVWTFEAAARPTERFLFGGAYEAYAGGTARILGLDGSLLHDLGAFTAVNFTMFRAIALISDAGDGVFVASDPDFAPVSGLALGQLVAPLRTHNNSFSSDYFIRGEDGTVWRFWSTSGNFLPVLQAATPVPLPVPGLLLGTILAAAVLLRRFRRPA